MKAKLDAMNICQTKLKSNVVEEWNGVKCVRMSVDERQRVIGKEIEGKSVDVEWVIWRATKLWLQDVCR